MKFISTFSGAGGMDAGFVKAGLTPVWANEFDKHAANTYKQNFGDHIVIGDIVPEVTSLSQFKGQIDCVIGGPPCQGFSVAGRMDPEDPRSSLVFTFMDVVSEVMPQFFVMENVKGLGKLEKFKGVRDQLVQRAIALGYSTEMIIENSKDHSVAQSRERLFFIGFRNRHRTNISRRMRERRTTEISSFDALKHLGPAGSELNPITCNAKIGLASSPVLRKSPYAGMLFNGSGRPISPAKPAPTLPASMGGNKTPIIDDEQFYGSGTSWVEAYHSNLVLKSPVIMTQVPRSLRRLTIEEAKVLHSFPDDHLFSGPSSSIYKQIGNAVPCNLAKAVAESCLEELIEKPLLNPDPQNELFTEMQNPNL